jgi:hypothetical protein
LYNELSTGEAMNGKRLTARLAATVAAGVVMALAAYAYCYFSLGFNVDSGDVVNRYYKGNVQPVIFQPAGAVDSWLRGVPVYVQGDCRED